MAQRLGLAPSACRRRKALHQVFLTHHAYETRFGDQLILVWIFVVALNLAWVGWRRKPPSKPE